MSLLLHTAGPWDWFMHAGERPYLATPDRGRLHVMGFARKGMQGATPRFSHWSGLADGEPRDRKGGIMQDGILLMDGRLHPDARLIAAAPELQDALRAILFQVVQGGVLERDACITQARAAYFKAGGSAA